MPGTPTSGPADYPAGTARRDRQIASGTRNSACSRSMRDLLPSSIASWILRLNKIANKFAFVFGLYVLWLRRRYCRSAKYK